MQSYLVEVGDSNVGCVGVSIRVRAESKEAAVEIANDVLNAAVSSEINDLGDDIEYFNVYFNGAATVNDVPDGEIEDIEEDDDLEDDEDDEDDEDEDATV